MELNDLQEKVDDIKTNAKHYMKTWVFGIVAALTSVIYVLYSMVKLQKNQLSPILITAALLMGIVCALITKAAYGEIGFDKGYNSETWIDEQEKYNEACNVCLPYIDRVPNFYIQEEKERKALYRKSKLASVCLRYTDWFDEEGNYIGTVEAREKLDKAQEKTLKNCIKVKIYVPDMFKEKSRSVDNFAKKDKTDTEQRTYTITKNMITAIVPNFIQVLFVPVFTKWNWGVVISGLITVAIWTLTGLLQLYNNYNYVTKEKVVQLRDKKELMSKFIKVCESENV